ncbi:hypothetical protein C7974DRAFT_14039 [Boeremia exigua]|uniref:uncharacterized protein n=1 Tax=Boeremia exigua TaxID=749465 RepID=UPI001E8E9549|nr:uncharacterized protein C7974DRAFT_14039 [Boeremia exigua]KAH6644078.1 hypothetical protein C7974DRAFT_14039 [Boeremia exigua]
MYLAHHGAMCISPMSALKHAFPRLTECPRLTFAVLLPSISTPSCISSTRCCLQQQQLCTDVVAYPYPTPLSKPLALPLTHAQTAPRWIANDKAVLIREKHTKIRCLASKWITCGSCEGNVWGEVWGPASSSWIVEPRQNNWVPRSPSEHNVTTMLATASLRLTLCEKADMSRQTRRSPQ